MATVPYTITVNSPPVLPDRFCCSCGRKSVNKSYVHHYDEATGAPVYYTRQKCPLWWAFGYHRNRKYDNNGSEIEDYPYY